MNAAKQLISGKKTNGTSRFLPSLFKPRKPKKHSSRPVYGLAFFIFVLAALSVLGGVQFRPQTILFVAGEIATQDVTADQNLLVEDTVSTLAKRKQVAELQPPVFDLSLTPIEHLQSRVAEIFTTIDAPESDNSDPDQLRWQISEALNTEISATTVKDWQQGIFRKTMREDVLPWLVERLISGVTADKTLLLQYRHGIVIRDLTTETETIRLELEGIPDIKDLRLDLANYIKGPLKLPLHMRRSITALLTPLLSPTLTLNREATNQRIKMATESIDPVYNHIKKGEIIVRQGERVTEEDQMQLQTLLSHKRQTVFPMRIAGLFIVSLMLGGGLAFAKPGRRISDVKNKDLYFTGLLLLLFGIGAKMLMLANGSLIDQAPTEMRGELLPLLFPVSGGMGLVAMIFGFKRCSVTSLILSFMCAVMTGGGMWLFLFYFIGSMLYVLLVKRAQTRSDIALSIFPHIAGLIFTWMGVAMFQRFEASQIWLGCLYVLGNGLLSLLVQFAVSPLIEMVFSYTTRFRLMELMNLEQPMLQELMLEAPGTYHHSLIVANMVEAGAKSIGANSLLCKVAALYHDMGKLSKPEYFIENQGRAKNPHDKIAPSMSTLVISTHVKRGVEMARQHRLGDEIADIIEQHHGTSLIRYFFNKAKEAGDNPREEDYSYPGPKPQTREAAIVMLADAVEASSRVLADPTPSRIRGHIDTIIKTIFAEGQLDESELTLRDLHTLSDSFHRILTGIFHRRIEYPDDKKDKSGSAKKGEDKQETKQGQKNGASKDSKDSKDTKDTKETPAASSSEAKDSLSASGSDKKTSNPLQ
ncbi:HDIG domain-containing protein [Desulfovibrio mangrovi]|uniref:HDIG domain-containing metalloprotein n=1 Tax=Desulfovibrio mangrovi TaxID=2976983 RepID=UPI002245D5D6|nr:HDIG domain-containing metalloprotein [Desulfovibrio mangrovi]UZP68073.1 HDIG domain-containing protein [Desulfovibrio mangrovi]